MSKSARVRLAAFLVMLISLALGYWLGASYGGGIVQAENRRVVREIDSHEAVAVKLATISPTPDALGESHSSSTGFSREAAKQKAIEALEPADRFERLRRLYELLAHVTPENWRDVLEGFNSRVATDRRMRGEEWKIALERIGGIGGQAAVIEALGAKDWVSRKRANSLLVGWAAEDPGAAADWFNQLTPETQEPLMDSVLRGLSHSDPVQAMTLALGRTSQAQARLVPDIVAAVVEQGGFGSADKFFRSVAKNDSLPEQAKKNLFWAITQNKITASDEDGTTSDLLRWFAPYVDNEFVGPAAVRDVITVSAKNGPVETLNWLEANEAMFKPTQVDGAFPALADSWYSRAPNAFGQWIDDNLDHPHRDRMIESVAKKLVQANQLTDALSFAAKVKDIGIRANIERAVTQRQNLPH